MQDNYGILQPNGYLIGINQPQFVQGQHQILNPFFLDAGTGGSGSNTIQAQMQLIQQNENQFYNNCF